MSTQAQIPTGAHADSRRFAIRLALFYVATFGLIGAHLPFFTVWLKAVGIDPWWIGVISAIPALTRFTVLPVITGNADRRYSLRTSLIATALVTAIGFAAIGTQSLPLAVLLAYVVTCCAWTPMMPLTDAYALRGVRRFGLNYGPLRLWGSAAFVAGALACGLLVDAIAAIHLIWVIVSIAALAVLIGFGLEPLGPPKASATAPQNGSTLLRDGGFLAIIVTSALIQGSHAAYYTFASIAWQQAGLGGMTIAGLWSLGVMAEIVLFAVSPRLRFPFWSMVVIAALSAVLRWIVMAQSPSLAVLAAVQLAHGLSYGLTQVGTMSLLAHRVPGHMMARGQGYLAACAGIVTSSASVASGAIYSQFGQGVYYLMAGMALAGALVMWAARVRLASHRHGSPPAG